MNSCLTCSYARRALTPGYVHCTHLQKKAREVLEMGYKEEVFDLLQKDYPTLKRLTLGPAYPARRPENTKEWTINGVTYSGIVMDNLLLVDESSVCPQYQEDLP